MSNYEKLLEEFGCAIKAVLGDQADEEFEENKISESDLIQIAKKVAFYIDAE